MSFASVIIVTHNRRDLLRQSLQAVLEQDVPVQLIVMDDASVDGTGEMMAKEFPQAIYQRTADSRGPSWQRNEGARKACADFLIFLDDDTLLMYTNG